MLVQGDCSLSDGIYVSMLVETKVEEDGPVDEITLLGKDLNLYYFKVNNKRIVSNQ